ncbi:MAG: glutamate racemase [Elusimicrobiota bacterium]
MVTSKSDSRLSSESFAYQPVGVFDSGVGGLTVVKELIRQVPRENVIYVGDTAHVPYGTKSAVKVTELSLAITRFLVKQHIKLLVVACNTASALALEALQKKYPLLKIVGVITPGAGEAVRHTHNLRVGVIGTAGTINSGAYKKHINRLNKAIKVYSYPCPLFVPLAEEGWGNTEVAYLTAEEYLKPVKSKDVDVLVLGCTHYPLLKPTLAKVMGAKVKLVDSASATAAAVKTILTVKGLLAPGKHKGWQRFYVTDDPGKFNLLGSRFLKRIIRSTKLVDIGQ